MKWLILNTDYPEVLRWLYAPHPGAEKRPYEELRQVRTESLFGLADFCSSNLRKLGHEAMEIWANNELMQKAWMRERAVGVKHPSGMSRRWPVTFKRARRKAAATPLRHLKPLFHPMLSTLDSQRAWFYEILAAQIKHYRPDVLLNQSMAGISGRFLRESKPYLGLLVGQIASPFPQEEDSRCYDLVISSLPNFVQHFRRMGIPSELNRLAFEPRVLKKLEGTARAAIPVSFVGALSQAHAIRARWLEYLCQRTDVRVWGTEIDGLPDNSPIRQRYLGRAWGIDMYQILLQSRITLNRHIDLAGTYANNCRLYEATGVGTLLITDWKQNLHEMFEPGVDLVAYRTPEECADLIQYYLEHDQEREAIARAGQERTLREHTYSHRMQELLEIVKKYLK